MAIRNNSENASGRGSHSKLAGMSASAIHSAFLKTGPLARRHVIVHAPAISADVKSITPARPPAAYAP